MSDPDPGPRPPRRLRLEPGRRALDAAVSEVASRFGLSRSDEVELLSELLALRVQQMRRGRP